MQMSAQETKAIGVSFPQNGDSFAVFGDWTPSGYSSAAHVFDGETVTYSSSSSSWSYTDTRYWQWNGHYDFKAIYPSDVTFDAGSNGKTTIVQYSMHEDKDLMAASYSTDVAYSDATPHSAVSFNFRHACAAGQIQFRKGVGIETQYYLRSFELSNLRTVGTFFYTAVSGTDGPAITRSNWIVSDNRASSVFRHSIPSGVVEIQDTYAATGISQWHYVIPQDMAPDTYGNMPSVKFTVAVGTGENAPLVNTEIPLPTTYDHDNNPATPEVELIWEPGKVYVYGILIQPKSASITVKATDWSRANLAVEDIVLF